MPWPRGKSLASFPKAPPFTDMVLAGNHYVSGYAQLSDKSSPRA